MLVTSSGRIKGRGNRTRVVKSGGRVVDGFAVKGAACPNPGEVLLSAALQGEHVLAVSYTSSRRVPVRKNSKRTRSQRTIRTVLCTKHATPEGDDYFWVVDHEQRIKL